ncbi:MAG TPA: hypothetical protein VKU86_15570 [Acidimicrobiales bacterium]|nr:hypothetical protein [Acidimicrobiales bacterium]
MPVAPPDPEQALLTPPDAEEATRLAYGIASAAAPPSGLTQLQRLLLEAIAKAMTEHPVSLQTFPNLSASELAELMRGRTLEFRSRIVQLMLLLALTLRPLPPEVVERICEYACELSVDDSMIDVAREFSAGSFGLAALDFERNGYTAAWHPDDASFLHSSRELQSAWDVSVTDPALARRWAELENLDPGTLGRGVWEMYQARGFEFPGVPGSAPPLLAQHDWVHVLADYGTIVESELEVFAFIARANDDLHAFSLLAMVVCLFETGYLRSGAGLFESNVGHLSNDAGHISVRLADAMYRGARCDDVATHSPGIDFLRMDWFELAGIPTEEVRRRFCIPAKSKDAVSAGSVGPWQPGGISPFQLNSGRAMAARLGRRYDAHGATPSPHAPAP